MWDHHQHHEPKEIQWSWLSIISLSLSTIHTQLCPTMLFTTLWKRLSPTQLNIAHPGLLRLSICTPIADFDLHLAASFENYPTTCCLKISVVCKAQE
jgi:hypothetical protein